MPKNKLKVGDVLTTREQIKALPIGSVFLERRTNWSRCYARGEAGVIWCHDGGVTRIKDFYLSACPHIVLYVGDED